MITSKTEYDKLLANIQDNYNAPIKKLIIPSTEHIYQIDLNTRSIEAPQILGVQNDHQVETIFFIIDRYFGMVDLSNTIGIIQYKNSRLQEYVYVIPYYDVETKGSSKIVFPWVVQSPATKYNGTVNFSIRFFKLNDEKNIIFDLNTLPAKTYVEQGWSTGIEDYSYTQVVVDASWSTVIAQLQQYLSTDVNKFAIYWEEADDLSTIQTTNNSLQNEIVSSVKNST